MTLTLTLNLTLTLTLTRMDEAGIVMWEETLGPDVSVSNLQDAAWMGLQQQQLGEM